MDPAALLHDKLGVFIQMSFSGTASAAQLKGVISIREENGEALQSVHKFAVHSEDCARTLVLVLMCRCRIFLLDQDSVDPNGQPYFYCSNEMQICTCSFQNIWVKLALANTQICVLLKTQLSFLL